MRTRILSKAGLLFAAGLFLVAGLALSNTVTAQEEVPPPYAGMKNPFPWDEAAVRQAGQSVYEQSCQGCHGASGDGVAAFDFGTEDYASSLQERPDYFFWVFSEGRLTKGMPPYKSSLSDEERWQVLTYMGSLGESGGEDTPDDTTLPPEPSPAEIKGNIFMSAPEQAFAGSPLIISAAVRDEKNQPVAGAEVKLFIKIDFFASGLIEIGEAVTDEQGVAIFEHVPRQTGEIELVALYQDIEGIATISLLAAGEPLYKTEAGLHFPPLVDEVIIGPESAKELGPMGQAPNVGLRIPGGTAPLFFLLPLVVLLIWLVYFRVMHLVSGIPGDRQIGEPNTKLVPTIGLFLVAAMGILLLLMLLTGPYSHFNLMP